MLFPTLALSVLWVRHRLAEARELESALGALVYAKARYAMLGRRVGGKKIDEKKTMCRCCAPRPAHGDVRNQNDRSQVQNNRAVPMSEKNVHVVIDFSPGNVKSRKIPGEPSLLSSRLAAAST